MSANEKRQPATLTKEAILAALRSLGTEEASDVADITFLIRHLKLTSAKAVLDLVAQYYPAHRIPVKTQYLIDGLFVEGKI